MMLRRSMTFIMASMNDKRSLIKLSPLTNWEICCFSNNLNYNDN